MGECGPCSATGLTAGREPPAAGRRGGRPQRRATRALASVGAARDPPAQHAPRRWPACSKSRSRVRFRHPLMRAAIPVGVPSGAMPGSRRACPGRRRAVRSGTSRMASRPRRVCAGRERRRRTPAVVAGSRRSGGVAAEAEFLRLAAALTPDPTERARRGLASAEAARLVGDVDGALQSLITAEAGPLDPVGRARGELCAPDCRSAPAPQMRQRGSTKPPGGSSRSTTTSRVLRIWTRSRRLSSSARMRAAIRSTWPAPCSPHGASGQRGRPTCSSTGWRSNSRRAT